MSDRKPCTEHKWHINGMHSNDFCGVCFVSKPKEPIYARPNGTRNALLHVIEAIKSISDLYMPGNFHIKARNLIVDMENEMNRKEGN